MGIYNRDYLRDDGRSTLSSFNQDWALRFLLAVNIGVFLLQNLAPQVTASLSLSLADVRHFEVWRLLTYGFCHAGISHIFWNMFGLWIFGKYLEPIYGSREFLAFYLVGILISGLCHLLFEALSHIPAPAIGASGGVMAVTMLAAMHFPRMQMLIFFVLPIELRWLAVLYVVADVAGLTGGGTGVAHAAHLGGAAFGVAYRYFHWRILSWSGGWKLPRPRLKRRPKLRVYQPEPPANLEAEVDRILAKIHDHGEASLTDQERETLRTASRKYKHRT